MSLLVEVRHAQGEFTLELGFESKGRLTAIFGASGSGKTTLVNIIAGLVKPQQARIVVDDSVLTDTAKGIAVPPHKRRIGYVFQDARLFPHLSVAGNLGFGEWFTRKDERYANRDQILELLGIGHLLARKPRDLSGGEKQRVAIGRALLASPRLLLMDEPLASLDQKRKDEIMPYLERLRDELRIPIVYVSHSVAEVLRLASDIAVLSDGRLAGFGPAGDIAQRLDLIPAEERDEGGAIIDMQVAAYDAEFGMTRLSSPAGEVHVPGFIGPAETHARLRIRARDVMIATSEPRDISALNILSGTITAIQDAGPSAVIVSLDCGGSAVLSRITRKSAAALGLKPGLSAHAMVKAVSVSGPGRAGHAPDT